MPDDPVLAAMRAHERDRDSARYERLEELGRGGMAVVFRARDRKLGRDVALKVMRDDVKIDPEGLARFRREAEAAARLSHPNIVTVLDAGEDAGQMVIAMELVRGETLAHLLAARRIELRPLVVLLEKVARGVHHAHERGIVHRDLKPSNVLVTATGEPKVADFGLAHLGGRDTALTRSGALLGTPLYMAPEQAEGRVAAISPRTDVYALGAMLYEMLSGRPPHVGDTALEICRRIIDEEPITPRRLNTRVSRDLEVVALVAIDKDPRRRFPSAAAFADDLRRWLAGEPVVARPAGPLTRAVKWVRRHPTRSSVAALLALAALVAILLRADTVMRTAREKASATLAARRAEQAGDWEAASRAWTQLEALGDPAAGRQAAAALARAREEAERRRGEEMAAQAAQAVEEYDRLKRRVAEATRRLEEIGRSLVPWDPPDRKREGWAVFRERRDARPALAALEARVIALWSSALKARPGHEAYARALVAFLWPRLEEAEREEDVARERFIAETIRRLALEHGLKDELARLDAGGTVALSSDPPAEMFLFRYEEADDLRLMPRPWNVERGESRRPDVESTPDTAYALECSDFNRLPPGPWALPVGSWLVVLRRAGQRDVRYPVHVVRSGVWRWRIDLPDEAEYAGSWVFVTGGRFLYSDQVTRAMGETYERSTTVGDFFIARRETTWREYAEFLNDRAWHDADRAWARAPRGTGITDKYWSRAGDRIAYLEGADDMPAIGVSWDDATEYCRWLTARDPAKREHRLPTHEEWQRAGRGADGRVLPWGWEWDWGFANGLHSRQSPEFSAVESFPADESPFGVRDLSGSVREWCLNGPAIGGRMRFVAGGGWLTGDAGVMRLAPWNAVAQDSADQNIGFRVLRLRSR